MPLQSKSRAGAIVSTSQSATDLTTYRYHQSRLEAHQPQSPSERTAQHTVQMKNGELAPPKRISFQDTPVCSSSTQRNMSKPTVPTHTPYALYNRSASRLEGFPYRDSLWEAQLKDQPYGRLSCELDRHKESAPGRRKADSTRSLSNDDDGSLDSSDADLDLTVELASPDTSYGTPGDHSHLATCPTHACTAKADFTSISIINSSGFLTSPPSNDCGPSTPETHPVSRLESPLNDVSPQVPSSPSELPYAPWPESPLAHAYVESAVDPAMPLKTASVSPNLGQPCTSGREFTREYGVVDASQTCCGCSVPQGYSHNPTPPIGLGISLLQPKPVVRQARITSEVLEGPPTPALIHAFEESNMEHLSKEDFDTRKEPDARPQASLQYRRRSPIGSESLRIVVDQQNTNETSEGQLPLTLNEPRLTSPSSSFTNSPASLVVAFCSPYPSTAPTSPSIYSPGGLHLSPELGGRSNKKHHTASTSWRGSNIDGGWQALNDFFTSRAAPQPSSRPFSTREAHPRVLASDLPSPGVIDSAPRLSTSWASSNAIESLVECVSDLQDDVEKYWIHNPCRLTTNHSPSSPSWVPRTTGDPRLPTIPTIDEDREPAKRTRTSTSLLVLNTDTLEDLKDGRLPMSSQRNIINVSPERRGRTTSVPFFAISPPEETHSKAQHSPRRSSWQHQRTSLAHPMPTKHHFRQTSVPSIPRQRLGFNVGGLPTISAAENARRNAIDIEDHQARARPISRFSDSESSMVLVEAEADHAHRIRLGQQRSSGLKPILMTAEIHPAPTNVVKGRRSSEIAAVIVSKSKRLSNLLLDPIKQALPLEKTGPHLRSFLTSAPARNSQAHSWRFVTMLEQTEPAAVAFWLGCILGPWFFIIGGWYLSAHKGELGRALNKPRFPIRNRNISNGNPGPSTPCELSWVLANRVAAGITGPLVMGAFIWSLVTVLSN